MNKIYLKPFFGVKNPVKHGLDGLAKRSGFTLIELLVVVLIIGVLAAAALPQYRVAVEKARVLRVLPLMRSISEAKQRYYMETGNYSTDLELLDVKFLYISKGVSSNGLPMWEGVSGGNLSGSGRSDILYWETPQLIIDFGRYWKRCYPRKNGSVGDKVCASLGPKEGVVSAAGTNLYAIEF